MKTLYLRNTFKKKYFKTSTPLNLELNKDDLNTKNVLRHSHAYAHLGDQHSAKQIARTLS